ncbi:MAG: ComF family protein [Sphingomonadaceae bacterium]
MAALGVIVDGARAVTRGLVDVLMPPRCMACGADVLTPLGWCPDCFAALPALAQPCRRCAQPLPDAWAAEAECLGCVNDPPAFARTAAPFRYAGPARDVVLAFKGGREAYARPMAAAMARAAGPMLSPEALLVPVPLHRWRLFERGFNQSLLLARELARLGDARLLPTALRRKRATRRTRGLNRAQRQREMAGAFDVAEADRPALAGARVLLVDDVMTSGATARACAGALRRAGATHVDVLVFARVAATD